MARVIKNVKIGPSPKWLADKIISMGSKPINNVVDVTNYIMYDLGQPLHAFDLEKIKGSEIITRKATEGETIETLDGNTKTLFKDTLVIADKERPIAIAGIMGGANSEVDQKTTNIVIEAAEFNRISIRKSSKKLGLSTEASYRFERGIDSGGVEYSLNKAAKLIADFAGGTILNGIVRSGQKPTNAKVLIEYRKINNLLGLELSKLEINTILHKLGFEIEDSNAIVPLWRKDISVWQDLAEEVGRLYGYGKIKPIPIQKTESPRRSNYFKKEDIKDLLTEIGFVETQNYAFLSEKDTEPAKLKTKDLLEVANPLQVENKYLRSSLIPGLLKNIAKNPTFDPVLLFEIGKVFTKKEERTSLAVAASGKNASKFINDAVNKLSDLLPIKKDQVSVSELSSEELQRFKIKKPITFVLEVNLDEILLKWKVDEKELKLKLPKKMAHYRLISKYPSVTRDLAFIVDKSTNAELIRDEIYNISKNINRVELFDEFASDKFGKNKKNVAYHLYLEEMERTMTDREADQIIKNVTENIEKKFNAKLRSE
jgi:phenylalanyl-tRNA synthetase beta chain